MRCTHDDGQTTLFCSLCGKEREKGSLRRVRLQPRFTGAASTSPKMEKFFETGDPAVFSKPGDPDYNPNLDV